MIAEITKKRTGELWNLLSQSGRYVVIGNPSTGQLGVISGLALQENFVLKLEKKEENEHQWNLSGAAQDGKAKSFMAALP